MIILNILIIKFIPVIFRRSGYRIKILINTINQYSCYMASVDLDFKKALQHSDILLPDGVGVTLSAWLIYGKKIKKIAGADIHEKLLMLLQQNGGRCFYLGASDNTLLKIKDRVNSTYPAIQFASYSPPFKPQFNAADNDEMIKQINAFKPHVLFVGMTAPKQEKWADIHKQLLNANIICSIGAVFDFYAGTITRPQKYLAKVRIRMVYPSVKRA